ncbi:MAG: ABC transporter permease subunit, partial [Thermoleophilia bacterium]|nr:ABC transporter permease subunit [Thermoleophilia bacterium]
MDADRPALSVRRASALAYGVPLTVLALFFVVPLATIVERGLLPQEGRSALDVLADPLTREVVWFTLWQAVASTALTFLVALPATYVVGRFAFRGRALVRALVVAPFVLPTLVVALAFLAVLPEGLDRGWAPILLAHAFFNVAVVVLVVGTFWAGIDRRLAEAAATLGAGRWQRLREVTLPALAPALAAAAALVFRVSRTAFGVGL